MAQFSRRHVLGLGAGALSALHVASGMRRTMAAQSSTAFRHSAS